MEVVWCKWREELYCLKRFTCPANSSWKSQKITSVSFWVFFLLCEAVFRAFVCIAPPLRQQMNTICHRLLDCDVTSHAIIGCLVNLFYLELQSLGNWYRLVLNLRNHVHICMLLLLIVCMHVSAVPVQTSLTITITHHTINSLVQQMGDYSSGTHSPLVFL